MKDTLRRVLPYVGYAAFYLFCFGLFSYLTFPYQKVRDRIVADFALDPKGRPTNQRIEIEELSPYWFTGVRAKGVKVTIAPPPKVTGEPDPPLVVEVQEMHARAGIFAKLLGKTKVSYYVKAFGGEIEGMFVDSATERKLELDLDEVSVSRVDALSAMVGLPMVGVLKGHVDLTFPDRRASKAEGSMKLTFTDLAVGDGKAKIKGMLALPKVNVGELALEADVAAGVVKVSKLGAAGGDLELAGDGKIQLRDQPMESQTDLYFRFKFSDGYRNKNDTTRLLLGAPGGGGAPPMFEMDPQVKSSKRSDGFYGWHMLGLLSSPKFEAFAGSSPGGRPAGGAATVKGFGKP